MRKLLFILSLFLLISCQDYNAGWTKESILKDKYQIEFVQEFGEINPNHTWGFSYDQTRAYAFPNQNEWYNTPKSITSEEKAAVEVWFSKERSLDESITLNLSDFFVQHVSKGNSSYETIDNNNTKHDVKGSSHMDKLAVNGVHILNFNGADGSIMLIYDSESNNFSYEDSYGTESKTRSKYIIQYVPDYGYYLGFDYQTKKDNGEEHTGDNIFNDWIIKIVPGDFKEGVAHRVFAEDLGSIGDWDFNDVVFDYYMDSSGNGIIKLLAAGGTLPIHLGAEDKEVHTLFGVSSSTPVNVGTGVTKAPVVWRFTGNPLDSCYSVILVVDAPNLTYEIEANRGKAPGKICVPTSVEWTKENQHIRNKYPNFDDWVSDPNNHFWK